VLSDYFETSFFGTVEDICSIIMAGKNRPWAPRTKDLWGEPILIEAERLVVLDEIGARQKVTDLHYSAVKEFADVRELDHSGVAIYISNLEPAQLAAVYDDRIASRLLCGTWFKLDGKDRRMGEK
jgi:hypothetical protein